MHVSATLVLYFNYPVVVVVVVVVVQLSWIQQALANPDVFCFLDYSCHPIVVDLLKSPPEDENRELASWYALKKMSHF